MGDLLQELKERAIKGRDIRQEEAAGLCEIGAQRPFALMAVASEIREFFKGKRVNICGIVNAKSGKCPENCRFCIQSVHYETASPVSTSSRRPTSWQRPVGPKPRAPTCSASSRAAPVSTVRRNGK